MSIRILGIRHHGPGSARAVADFLEQRQPDIVLVEGPPEGDALLEWALHEDMEPPVALLVYNPDRPRQASFYPFAVFSPEWQAIRYARKAGIPVKFMDLPAVHDLAFRTADDAPPEESAGEATPASETAVAEPQSEEAPLNRDPIGHLARAAGWSDSEAWWDYTFENRHSSEGCFDAIGEAMTALRETVAPVSEAREKIREAWMRKVIRQAEREMYTNIVVICGAWHVPGLSIMPKQKDDNELLKGLPKVKAEATWVPWTYDRLSYFSGYGAGIMSPGWYHHVWEHPADDGTRWMTQVATLFREKGMDTSVAHVIESVRLAESLAALRGYSKPGLPEMNEAVNSIMCGGDGMMMRLIQDALIVGNRIGKVPDVVPQPPLQADIEKHAKTLRLARTADFKDYTFDLRKEFDLQRSVFLHRLGLLGIGWGEPMQADGKGTFKEGWRLQWSPDLSITVIEKGSWGNTLEAAATSFVVSACKSNSSLTEIAALLQHVLPAELPEAAALLSAHLGNMAAASGDVLELVKIIPPLARIVRYGNVRNTDSEMVLGMLDNIVTRVCIGLPLAAVGINEEAAQGLTAECLLIQEGISLLQEESYTTRWQNCLRRMSSNDATAPMLQGFALRQLMDYQILDSAELYGAFSRACSTARPSTEVAAWLEGFLSGRGTVLLIDDMLWKLVDDWVATLDGEVFTAVLPLLRRTFATFSAAERRKLGEKAKGGTASITVARAESGIDAARARKSLAPVLQLLGITAPNLQL
jgi:hypothetical protein